MSSDHVTDAQLRLAAIVASSDDAIISTDLAGTITSWNRAAEGIFGYTESEIIGRSFRLIVPPDLYPQADEVLERVHAGERVDHSETTRLRKDGHSVEVSLTVSPIATAEGRVLGASEIARDITDRRRLERAAQHLASIISSSEDAIISKDLCGLILSWNPSAERLFGYSAAEAIGQNIRLIIPANRLAEEDRVLDSVRRGETVEHFETERQRKDGTRVPISLTVSPIRSARGEIVGASKIARDLSRVRGVQRDALRLAAIVGSSDDAIASKDLDGIVLSWNGAAETMFGYTAEEIVGRSIRLLIPDDRQREEDEVLSRIRRGERVEHYETIRRRKDGSQFPVSLSVSPLRNERGVVVGASKIARDITDRKRAEEERHRLLVIARDASRLKDEFLATLSHELRTPLNAIVGYVRMIQSGLLTGAKREKAIDVVSRNVTSLTQIVEDVLDVSRIISGKLRLELQPVDVPMTVEEALETVRPAAEAKGVRLEMAADDDVIPAAGDPQRLRQIMWNLLSNAVKFTDRGGRVDVRVERAGFHIVVIVSDTGIGIPAEFLPYVFDRFRQADAGIGRVRGGLGLGLAITRHLVELQGGHISAESGGSGMGSVFRVELPVSLAHTTGMTDDQRYPAALDLPAAIAVPQLHGLRILAVDDDRDTLALVREILEATGASVTTADSGREALEAVSRTRPDLLVADLAMPEMTGYELIDHVRQSEDLEIRTMPAAALTAFARSEDSAKALRSGFQMHLAKPVDPAELMNAMATLARRVGSKRRHE